MGITDVGLQRDHNEDTFAVLAEHELFIVADGMGGHRAGDVASRLASESISDFFQRTAGEEVTWPFHFDSGLSESENRLLTAIRLANRQIYEHSLKSHDLRGMGTTVVGALFNPETRKMYVGHVGDSRAYVIRDGKISQLTRDHSLVNDYLKVMPDMPEDQRSERPKRSIPILPNIAAVRDEAIRLFSRDANFGFKIQRETGEGAEFHALRDFQPGMDIRAVDWKQSARHAGLLAKEYRTERNHHIVFALDCGRMMSEPVAGMPRLDRALNAALLLAFVSLKLGDRVGLFAFDSKVRVATGAVAGVRGFSALQHLAATIDYSVEEANFTLGLSTLAGRLERRSLVVVFTDFPDSVSAELMIENVGRLLKRHVVLFVAMRDAELETLVQAEPITAEDVSRAVTAGALLRERELVLGRLRRLGVEVLEAPLDRIGVELVNAYLALKRKNVL